MTSMGEHVANVWGWIEEARAEHPETSDDEIAFDVVSSYISAEGLAEREGRELRRRMFGEAW